MLKQLRKPTHSETDTMAAKQAPVTCGACGHQRAETARNPDWQCPNCEAAYAKVNSRNSGVKSLRVNAKGEHIASNSDMPGWMSGVMTGIATMLAGVGSACAAANPLVLAAGALIIAGSIGYAMFTIFG